MKTTANVNYVKPVNAYSNPIKYLEYLDTLVKQNEQRLSRMDVLIIESKLIISNVKETIS
jgi:hypothetical protein